MISEEKLEEIMPGHKFVLTSESDSVINVRCSLSTEAEMKLFVKSYEREFGLKYIVANSKNPKRVLFNKTWVCQYSNKNKRKDSKFNAQCKAAITALIQKMFVQTKKVDKFLSCSPPLPGILVIKPIHTHAVATDALRMIYPNDVIKQTFFSYFENCMTITEAKRFHESKLLCEDASLEDFANSSLNPTRRQVEYLYSKWKKNNFGSVMDPLHKLNDKVEMYRKEGTYVKVDISDPWTVLVVTPVMKRSQCLPSSSEIIFINSTNSCETTETTFTTMLTATKAGAIPIAVFIQKYQTVENYKKAFNLLKFNFPEAFGFKKEPAVFMIEDSEAEKQALKDLWPATSQLLYHFHVAQAEWRWLSANIISAHEREGLMKLFQTVMCAPTEQNFATDSMSVFKVAGEHPDFVLRFALFSQRRKEWALYCRNNVTIGDHNENNFSEASVIILKDVVLNRTKSFNVITLVEFCVRVWETYLISTLSKYAYNSIKKGSILYENMCSKFIDSKIQIVNDTTFRVPGETDSVFYVVDTVKGICSCFSGRLGGFCKHQSLVYKSLKIDLPNAPVLDPNYRYVLAKLASGDKCPEKDVFMGLAEDKAYDNSGNKIHLSEVCTTNSSLPVDVKISCSQNINSQLCSSVYFNTGVTEEEKQDLNQEIKRLAKFVDSSTPKAEFCKLINFMDSIKTSTDLNFALTRISETLPTVSTCNYKN